jgi:MFS family permease
VLLVNVPLAVITVVATPHAVRRDPRRQRGAHVDLPGAATLGLALFGLVLGLAQSQAWGWGSPLVLGALLLSVASAVAFAWIERRSPSPLLSFALLRRHPNHLAATVSQVIAGIGEMGLALLFPLLLILNLQMSPGLAGLALLPTTLPMVIIAPLAGRWYDKIGVRAGRAAPEQLPRRPREVPPAGPNRVGSRLRRRVPGRERRRPDRPRGHGGHGAPSAK